MWDHVLYICNSDTLVQLKKPAKEEVISLDQKTDTLAIQHVSEIGRIGVPKSSASQNCMVHTHALTEWQRLSSEHCEGSSCHNPRTRTTEDFWSKELAWPEAVHTEVFDVNVNVPKAKPSPSPSLHWMMPQKTHSTEMQNGKHLARVTMWPCGSDLDMWHTSCWSFNMWQHRHPSVPSNGSVRLHRPRPPFTCCLKAPEMTCQGGGYNNVAAHYPWNDPQIPN